MERHVSLYSAKTHFSEIIDRVEAGSEYIVTRNGVPCARVIPFRKPKKVPLGFVDGSISERFFDPLPVQELAAWEGALPRKSAGKSRRRRRS